MNQLTLNITERNLTGANISSKLRVSGQIPAVIYGKSGNRNLTINAVEFKKVWNVLLEGTALIDLVEGENHTRAYLQDFQRDPISGSFVHVDLKEVPKGEIMTARIRVHMTNVEDCEGVKTDKGLIELHMHEIEIRCLPRHLPSRVEVDVTNLRGGQSIHVKDLPVFEGVEYTSDKNAAVIACSLPAATTSDEAAEAAAATTPAAAPAADAAKK